MIRFFNNTIDIVGRRRIIFITSAVVIAICCIIAPLRGVNLGSDLSNGNTIILTDTGDKTIEQVRSAASAAGLSDLTIQTTRNIQTRENGFILITSDKSTEAVTEAVSALALALELDASQVSVSRISPSWQTTDVYGVLITLAAGLVACLLYAVIRQGYKAMIAALVSVLHSLLLVAGIYLACGFVVTENSLTALFVVMVFGFYNTLILFSRINEMAANSINHSFYSIANHAVNQMLNRTLSVMLAALVPLIAVLIFSSATLFSLIVVLILGLIVCPCSGIIIGAPVYAVLRQLEPKYARLYERFGEGVEEFSVAEQLGT